MGWPARICKGARAVVLATTVEPLPFLIYGFSNVAFTEHVGFYRRVCHDKYGMNASVDCTDLSDNHEVELDVQRTTADYGLYTQLCVTFPAIFADLLFGALGDKYGRQVNILFGVAGLLLSEFIIQMILSKTVALPPYMVIVSGFVTGTVGSRDFFTVSAQPYLADTVPDKKKLVVRLGIFELATMISSFGGSLIGAYLVSETDYATILAIELAGYTVAFFYILIRVKQRPLRINAIDVHNSKKTATITGHIWESVRDGWLTLVKPRKGSRRFLIMCLMLFFLMVNASNGETRAGLISQFVVRATGPNALGWDAATLSTWMSAGYLLQIPAVITLAAAKHFWNIRDTTLLLVCLASCCSRNIIIGLASETWHMYLANALGCCTRFSWTATDSLMSQLVEPNEVGKGFTLLAITIQVLGLIEAIIFTRIYKATLKFYPGFLYLLLAVCLFLSWLLALWVRRIVIVEDIEHSQIRKQPIKVDTDSKDNVTKL